MTWLWVLACVAVAAVLTRQRGGAVLPPQTTGTISDGSLYRVAQRVGGQAGLVTGARARTREARR
jgi:ribosomal protein L27